MDSSILNTLSEFLHYRTVYPQFSEFLESFCEANELIVTKSGFQPNPKLPETDKQFLSDFAKFLEIDKTKSLKKKFLAFCKSPLTKTERSILQRRIAELEANPEIGIPWETVIKNIEEIVGEPLSIPSRSRRRI